MSRIGERKLAIPEGIEVTVEGRVVTVKGSKGTLSLTVNPLVEVTVSEGHVITKQKNASKEANMQQGTTNSLIKSMIEGIHKGFEKGLEAVGVGYRFNVQGKKSNTEITIKGIDKQKVAEFAAKVREVREPEPYKGKGIRYKGEIVRRKEGKKAA